MTIYFKSILLPLFISTSFICSTPTDLDAQLHEAISYGGMVVDDIALMSPRDYAKCYPKLCHNGEPQQLSDILSRNRRVVGIILEKGANIEAIDKNGRTPLHRAILSRNSAAANILLEKGANIEAIDKDGRTPLHRAIWEEEIEFVDILLKNDADIESTGNDGFTPLLLAISHENRDAFDTLLEYKADIEATDKHGNKWTPLLLAASKGQKNAVNILLKHGANIEATRFDGKTADQIARDKGHKDMAIMLEKRLQNLREASTMYQLRNASVHTAAVGIMLLAFINQ